MFRKILIAAMIATAAGYCFAAEYLPQSVTSEVFYTQDRDTSQDAFVQQDDYRVDYQQEAQVVLPEPVPAPMPVEVPVWPIVGSDADLTVACDGGMASKSCGGGDGLNGDNIRIVSKVGADLVVENNFNLGTARRNGTGWSGGANMLHGNQIPVGFDDECDNVSEMPLLHREVLEDDGGNVLAMSRSGRKRCGKYAKYADRYDAYLAKQGLMERTANGGIVTGAGVVTVGPDGAVRVSTDDVTDFMAQDTLLVAGDTEMAVDFSADAEPAREIQDQVRSWVVANGQTLREVLQSWCDKEGWDLVWATSREYPIQASAVFKGRFVDVASAVVRNFGRAIPVPYAKFYKGNRVLVISTSEE